MFKVEAVVVGAGVVGLAIARALSLRDVKFFLLEKQDRVGGGTSSRSEVSMPALPRACESDGRARRAGTV
jgi:L-2-hydroxyglutarate oxidase LhgO